MDEYIIKRNGKTWLKYNDIDLKNNLIDAYLCPNGTGKTKAASAIFDDAMKLTGDKKFRPIQYFKQSLELFENKVALNDYFAFTSWGSTIKNIEKNVEKNEFIKYLNLTHIKTYDDATPIEFLTDFLKSWSSNWWFYKIFWIDDVKSDIFNNHSNIKCAINLISSMANEIEYRAKHIKIQKLNDNAKLKFNYFSYCLSDFNTKLMERNINDGLISTQEQEEFSQSDLYTYTDKFIECAKKDSDFASALIGFKRFLVLKLLYKKIFNKTNIDEAYALTRQINNDLSESLNIGKDNLKEELIKLEISIKKVDILFEYDKRAKINSLSIIRNNKNITKDFLANLSTGERGRFNFAVCIFILKLICKSNYMFLILDDPVDSYDDYHKSIMINMLKDLKERGVKILLFTHDIHFVSQLDSTHTKKYFFERGIGNALDIHKKSLIFRELVRRLCINYKITKDTKYLYSLLLLSRRYYEYDYRNSESTKAINELIYYQKKLDIELLKSIVSIIYQQDFDITLSQEIDEFTSHINEKFYNIYILKRLVSEYEKSGKTNTIIDKLLSNNQAFINLISHNEDASINYMLLSPLKKIKGLIHELKHTQ